MATNESDEDFALRLQLQEDGYNVPPNADLSQYRQIYQRDQHEQQRTLQQHLNENIQNMNHSFVINILPNGQHTMEMENGLFTQAGIDNFETMGLNEIMNSMLSNLLRQQPQEDVKTVMTKKDINSLEKITAPEDAMCPICQEKITDTAIKTKCSHLFHPACIEKWFNFFSYKCPVCRAECGEHQVLDEESQTQPYHAENEQLSSDGDEQSSEEDEPEHNVNYQQTSRNRHQSYPSQRNRRS